MNEGDALLQYVAQYVKGRVPPEHELLVIEAVASTLTLMMSTPEFTNRLLIVQQLMAENWELHQALLAAKRPKRVAKRQAPKAKAAKTVTMAVKKTQKRAAGRSAEFKKGAGEGGPLR